MSAILAIAFGFMVGWALDTVSQHWPRWVQNLLNAAMIAVAVWCLAIFALTFPSSGPDPTPKPVPTISLSVSQP